MQQRNVPIQTGRRRGHGTANRTPRRGKLHELVKIPPAKTRNRKQTVNDLKAQDRRLGLSGTRSEAQRRLVEIPPVSVYRQGRRSAKHKPEAHRSKRGALRMSR